MTTINNGSAVWSARDGQGYFGFEVIKTEAARSEVKTLKRFNQDGTFHAVGLDAWLAWFSPLSSNGN